MLRAPESGRDLALRHPLESKRLSRWSALYGLPPPCLARESSPRPPRGPWSAQTADAVPAFGIGLAGVTLGARVAHAKALYTRPDNSGYGTGVTGGPGDRGPIPSGNGGSNDMTKRAKRTMADALQAVAEVTIWRQRPSPRGAENGRGLCTWTSSSSRRLKVAASDARSQLAVRRCRGCRSADRAVRDALAFNSVVIMQAPAPFGRRRHCGPRCRSHRPHTRPKDLLSRQGRRPPRYVVRTVRTGGHGQGTGGDPASPSPPFKSPADGHQRMCPPSTPVPNSPPGVPSHAYYRD